MPGIPTGNNIPGTGGNVLSSTGNVVSGNNIPSSAAASSSAFAASPLWFSAQNIDGSNNSTLTDGQTIGTWVNLGTLGAAGNLIQATAGLRPTYVLVASAGKLGNKSCVRSDGTKMMQTAAISAMAQPNLVAAVAMTTTVAGGICCITDGRTAQRHIVGRNAAFVEIYAGSFVIPGGTWAANTYSTINCNFNGASTVARFNGTQTTINPNTNSLDGLTVFADLAGGSLWNGDIVEVVVNDDGSLTAATAEAQFVTNYGALPQ